jgi:mannose-6-phosphate isomerase
VHAIGAGNVIVEVQQNSDTTYRVFDWNRTDESGTPRTLHVEESLRCIDFDDCEPSLVAPDRETLVNDSLFRIEKWSLDAPREVGPPGGFAIVCCLSGNVGCGETSIAPGEFLLVPAAMEQRLLQPLASDTSLLRVTVGD